MFELLVTEYKIVLVSDHASMLNLVAECLCGWLYPLYWHHILIPVLPARLISYLEAPVPFLIGIEKRSFPAWQSQEWRPVDAAVIDLDNDHIDFTPLKIKIPHKERKKLVATLLKHTNRTLTSPQSPQPPSKGIPETMKYAFPGGKLCLQSGDSMIDFRKVGDIPKFMYSTYRNQFLQQKSGNILKKNSTKMQIPIHSGISQSFDNVGANNPSVTVIGANQTHEKVSSDIVNDSMGSFHPSPRQSDVVSQGSNVFSESNDSSGQPRSDGMLSLHQALINGPSDPNLLSDTSPTKMTPTALKFPNWWSTKPTDASVSSTATTSRAVSRETSRKKTPSFFERLLGSESSVNASQTIAESNESVEPQINEVASPNHDEDVETIVYKEGHVFHELLPNRVREVDIDESEDGSLKEYADRFTAESDSSDEFSRSDMSVVTDNKSQIFGRKSQRTAGQGRNAAKELFRRRGESTTSPTKTEQVKRKDRNACKVCKLEYDPKTDRMFMCELCHVQIHCNCINLIECHPCSVSFNEEKIGHAFFKLFTSLLRNYRQHLKLPAGGIKAIGATEDTCTTNWFKKAEFLGEFDSESKAFLAVLIETQAFAQFVLDRIERPETDYEVMFFDESIKQKLNRSRMRFTKEPTPFLNETTYRLSTKFATLPVNFENTPKDLFLWRDEYSCEPRPIQVLLTEADMEMMRSHTNELIQRSRTNKGKQDFSKWMRIKWKGNKGIPDLYTSDDQRRDILEERLSQVNRVIEQYESAHLSSQTVEQIDQAIQNLHEQNLILLKTTDDEQLVDSTEEEDFQRMIKRLIRLITLYEEQRSRAILMTPLKTRFSSSILPPLPPRRQYIGDQNTDRVAEWVGSIPRADSLKSNDDSMAMSQIARSSTSTQSSVLPNELGSIESVNEDFGSFDNLNDNRPTVSQRRVSQEIVASIDNLKVDVQVQLELYDNLKERFGSFESLRGSKTSQNETSNVNASIDDLGQRNTITAAKVPQVQGTTL